ncbi:hypothetical protein [Cytobacillus horneckiae]|uniref:phage tail protein n=1 Tax=Cytobacillus horneckiae TaxID=549687 RepID=UPI003D1F3256
MSSRLSAIVGARITEFRRNMARVRRTIRSIPRRTVTHVTVVTEEAEKQIAKFQNRLARLANTIRALGTVMSNMGQGAMLIVSPALIPILASVAGLLGSLGPMIGTIAGSTFALATAFGFAGGAALAFGAAAIPTIQKLFDENTKLNSAQKAAKNELKKLQKTWKGITKDLEKPVLEAFSKSMQFANKTLKMARPLFDSAAKAANNLLDSLNKSLDSGPVKAFFDYMNKQGGPILETVGKAVGNLMKGFMSMMTAFGPLAEKTAQGFLKMSEGFAAWAAGLSKSEKFQSFVNYINENMPKIRAIFRDALAGVTYFFAAFGPLSSDMMTSLQDMMARFKEWSKGLSENQQFQKFIGYIKANAPQVIALIGNITTFLVNLGIAMAPLGQKMLELVNTFLSWSSSMLQTYPIIGQIFGGLLMGVGVVQMLAPLILMITSMFSGFSAILVKIFPEVGRFFTMLQTKSIAAIRTSILWLGKMIAGAAKWAASLIASIAKVIAKYAVLAAKATLHAAKVALSFTVTMIKAAAKAALSMIKSMAQIIAKYAVLAAKSVIHAAKVAASWVVAMGPVGWVIATVVALVALIIANWDKIKAWTSKTFSKIVSIMRQKMDEAKQKVKGVLDKIKGIFDGMDLFASGKAIIQSAIDGLMAMKSKIVGKVEGIVGAVRDLWPFSPAKEGPLSDIHRMDFGGPITKSIARAKKPIMSSMTSLAGAARNAFTPDVALADIGGSVKVGANIKTTTSDISSKKDENKMLKGLLDATLQQNQILMELLQKEPNPQSIEIDGHEVVNVLYKPMKEVMDFNENRFSGGGTY